MVLGRYGGDVLSKRDKHPVCLLAGITCWLEAAFLSGFSAATREILSERASFRAQLRNRDGCCKPEDVSRLRRSC